LLKILALPKDALELYFFMPKARFRLILYALEATVLMREAPTVILINGDVAGFANLYGCEFGTV